MKCEQQPCPAAPAFVVCTRNTGTFVAQYLGETTTVLLCRRHAAVFRRRRLRLRRWIMRVAAVLDWCDAWLANRYAFLDGALNGLELTTIKRRRM